MNTDLVDFVSIHSYLPHESWFRSDIQLARRYAAEQGKPAVITECGSPGFGPPYPLAPRVAAEERIGFYLWELMIGKIMFRDSQGLLYSDGTTHDPETVAAWVGFSTGRCRHRSSGVIAGFTCVGRSGHPTGTGGSGEGGIGEVAFFRRIEPRRSGRSAWCVGGYREATLALCAGVAASADVNVRPPTE